MVNAGASPDKNGREASLEAVRRKFAHFHALLDKNHRILEIIGDMEEKSQGNFLFDVNYLRDCLVELREHVHRLIDHMIALGGDTYAPLEERYHLIDSQIDLVLPGNRPLREDSYTRPFSKLGRMHSFSVGSKNAQLGEMARLGMPVPHGFAITAWAYKHFIDSNNLQRRISELINSLDMRSYQDLVAASNEISALVRSAPVPQDLADAILKGCGQLVRKTGANRFSLRSSAVGEDTLFSFAGQYASYLNVPIERMVEVYREVLASKFTPKAIYYFLSHSLSESELAMSVGCVAMVDAQAAGVAYTRSPVDPTDEAVVVNAIFGLGKFLVDGTLTPDTFRVSRKTFEVVERDIATKAIRLIMAPEGGTMADRIPKRMQREPSLPDRVLSELAEYAAKLESHYALPQDIEWAVDRQGRLFLLQTRPLQVVTTKSDTPMPRLQGLKRLLSGGTTVCHGAGAGHIHYASSGEDLPKVPENAVLVAPNPFPGLITAMSRISALVTRVGGLASHMATIAREYGVPTLVGVEQALELPVGMLVTVDATGTAIYEGAHEELVEARRPEYDRSDEGTIYDVLGRVLDLVSPLRLVHPDDDDFRVRNCVTFHDITRFAHQKAIEEMFLKATGIEDKAGLSYALQSDIPMTVHILFLDREPPPSVRKARISEKDLDSRPMDAFWEGVKTEGWPRGRPKPENETKGSWFRTTITKESRGEFVESSFAIIGADYMIVSLRMGYHFSTVEAMASTHINKNFIRMQFNHGGATLERRARRVRLITDILRAMEFECQAKGDFLAATLAYKDAQTIAESLTRLGRLTMMVKQLDMALSNDRIAAWYTRDFAKKLGLLDKREKTFWREDTAEEEM